MSVFFNERTQEEQHWLLASLQLLQNNSLIREDWISQRNLSNLIKQLITSFQIGGIELLYNQIKSDYQAFERRKKFNVNGSVKLIVFDFILRLIFLWIRNIYEIDPFGFIGWNFLLFIPTLGIGYWRSKADKRYNQKLIAANGFNDSYKIAFQYSTPQYTLVGLLFVLSVTIPVFIEAEHYASSLLGVTLVGFLFYYWFLLVSVPFGRLSENEILDQLNSVELQSMDSDSNDEAIVLLETELNSKTGRLEAYVLESALFGALAFSGFLQIIATDLISFADLEKFSSTFYYTCHGFFLANWDEFNKYSTILNTKVNLFCLVSIETLLCSVFFLAVIASRLKFSDIADKVRTSINLAKAYNEKEEALLEMESAVRNQARLELLNKTIAKYLDVARSVMQDIKPIVSYMVYVRNAGLFTFLLVLLSSSLFITGVLGFVFIAIALATIAYFNLRKIVAFFASLRLRSGVYFALHRQIVLFIMLGVLLVAFVAHVFFDAKNTSDYVTLVVFLFGPYLFIWLAVMPHPDKNFDLELEKNGETNVKRYNLIRIFYGVGIFLFFSGVTFKSMRWPGGSELLIIGAFSIFFLNFFLMPYLTKPKWLSIPISFFISFLFFSILFRVQLIIGATDLILLATFSLPLFFVIYFFRRKSFHTLLVKLFVILIIPTILYSEFIFHPFLLAQVQMVYEHKTFKLKPIIETYDKVRIIMAIEDHKSTKVFDKGMESLDRYIKKYGNTLGRTQVYNVSLYTFDNFIGERVLSERMRDKLYNREIKVDSSLAKMVFKAADQMIKIDSVLGRYSLSIINIQADLYHIYHQSEKEKAFLEKMLRLEKDEEVQKQVKERLAGLKAKDIR